MSIITYAERFRVEPHLVNPPMLWWLRLAEYSHAERMRQAREYIETHGMAKADAETRRLYDEMVRQIWPTLRSPS